LQPGGILRVIVPDAGRFLEAYCSGSDAAFAQLGFPRPFPGDLPTPMDVVNHIFHQWHEHRWGYDFETLAERLRTVGFQSIVQRGFGESSDPHMTADREQHKPYSLYVDAVK
jgi:predicted SAM-dependent methyltransferase